LGSMIAVAFFVLTLFLAHRFRGKKELKERALDGLIAFCATISLGILFFVVELVILVPMQVYKEKQADDIAISQKDKRINSLSNSLANEADRLAKYSDALVTGKYNSLTDEPIASISARIELIIPSKQELNIWDASGLGNLCFEKSRDGNAGIITAWSTNFSARSLEEGKVTIGMQCDLKSTDDCIGTPISTLTDCTSISIGSPISGPVKILGGQVVCVINGRIILKFGIPPQEGPTIKISGPSFDKGLALLQGIKPLSSGQQIRGIK